MITFTLLVLLCAAVGIVVLRGRRRVPWAAKLSPMGPADGTTEAWMAPQNVLRQVERDYLAAVGWLQDSALVPWYVQLHDASTFYCDDFLTFYREQAEENGENPPKFVGVLRAVHRLEISHFSRDGEHCLVLDTQTERRMATYWGPTRKRLQTQHIPDATMVYRMRYDIADERWKIEQFVQELSPESCTQPDAMRRVRLTSQLSMMGGRDA